MTVYVSNLIGLALRAIGVKAIEDDLDPSVAAEALLMLNMFRKERAVNPVKAWHIYDRTYTFETNSATLTLGGDTSNITARPISVESVILINGTVDGSNNNWKLDIYPYADYRALMVQNIFAKPTRCYINTEYPTQTLYFYPGVAAGYSARVIGKSYSDDYESIADEFVDPPEVFELMRLNLALRLAPNYGVTDIMDLVKQAQSADKAYKASIFNIQMKHAMVNQAVPGGSAFNFWGGVNA